MELIGIFRVMKCGKGEKGVYFEMQREFLQ